MRIVSPIRAELAVAVAHRLARVLFQVWRTNAPFDERKLNVEAVTERRTKTVYYRLKKTA